MSEKSRAPRRTRAEMIDTTRAKLIATARKAFAAQGFAHTSMDELTATVGLTRGALHHHFKNKEGLLAAVVDQIDAEVDGRLNTTTESAPNAWEGFRLRCRAYLELALDAEIRRIVLQDARAVLGDASAVAQRRSLASFEKHLAALMREGTVVQADALAIAHMVNGAITDASSWIAEPGADHDERLRQALSAMDVLLDGLQRVPGNAGRHRRR